MQLLRNPNTLSLLGLLLLALLTLAFGELIGINSPQSRWLVAGALVATWLASALLSILVRIKSGATFERLFRAQFDKAVISATPEQRGEVALLRKQLLEAIAIIKKSHLGRTRGKAALYELPWYMIIGHPAAGKSSIIQHSELSFPMTEGGSSAIRGVGGTRNCDWFFSTEGILLDTAGRYATQREDHAEWLELLKLLKTNRPKTPINGILVTISLPELVQYRSEGFSEYARQIRARVGEIDQAFGRKVPIYLLITKLDLLGGFRQFFDHLPAEQRHQVWGSTFDVDTNGGGGRETVEKEFDLLVDGLVHTGMGYLNNQGSSDKSPALFSFPIEFKSLKAALDRFIELLFEEDPYHTKPLLRGFYFTSALQDGTPRIPAGDRVSRRFELTRSGFPSERLRDSTPYFVRDLFKNVIFPDQHLIAHQMRTVVSRVRWSATLAGIFALTLSLSGWSLSYANNYRLANNALRELQLFDTGDALDRMTRIGFVQSRLEQLASYSNNTPLSLQLGLYQGDKLSDKLKKIYTEEAAAQIVTPLKAALEQRLLVLASTSFDRNQNQINEFYDLLKTYLMLGEKRRADTVYLTNQLQRLWVPLVASSRPQGSDNGIVRPYIDQMISFYSNNLQEPYVPTLKIDDALVRHARTTLTAAMRQLPASERAFNGIIDTANRKYHAIGVAELLGNIDADLVHGSNVVSGAFTRAAWEGYIQQAIESSSRGSLQESDWVIATNEHSNIVDAKEIEKNRRYLLARYKAEYADTWKRFLSGLSVSRFQGLDYAITSLERLSDFKQSPISRLFSAVAQQTAWDNPALSPNATHTKPENLKAAIVNRLLPNSSAPANQSIKPVQYGELEDQFRLLGQLTDDQSSVHLVQYCAALAKVKLRLESIKSSGDTGKAARSLLQATNDSNSELAESSLLIDSPLLAGASAEMKGSLRNLLSQPLTHSYATAIPLASADINRRWQRHIYPEWQALAEKYPFSNSEGDATIDEIHAFLGDDTGKLDSFVDGELQGLLAHSQDRLVPRRWGGMALPFSPDFLAQLKQTMDLRDSTLKLSGAGRFELQPVPSPGISEVLLEIDGQTQRYRNGPQLWSTINWPGEQGQQHGAKITVTTFSGRSSTIKNVSGRLGWARLVAQASRDSLSSSTTQLTWLAPNPDNREGEPIAVRFNVRPISGTDPLALNRLSEITLPANAVR